MAYNVLANEQYDVGVDAGHAGFNKTPGKRSPDNEYEWDFNNLIAKALIKKLTAAGVKVIRIDDPTGRRDVPLAERVKKANDARVKVYVSLHHNANTGRWGNWTGIETFTMLGLQPGSDLLAEMIHDEIVKLYDLRDRGLKKASYQVLRETKMPAVLIETGFMDSVIDIKKLRDKALLNKAGEVIGSAVLKYLGVKEVAVPVAKPTKPISNKPTAGLIRVRTSWANASSQLGAFKDKYSAIELAKENPGYKAFDDKGTQVYPVVTPPKAETMFRVRKSWANVESQIGAYEVEQSAINLAKANKGYNVYDIKGKMVYPKQTKPVAVKKTTGVVTAGTLNVRQGANVTFRVVAQLNKGDKVDLLEEKANWYKILLDDADYAWVNEKFISNGKIVNCVMLNARSGPGVSNRVVDTVLAGKVFKTAGTKDGWVKIVLSPAEYGWVSGDFIK